MNSSIKIALLAAVAVAGMAACTSAPASQNNAAPQTSATPTSETPPPAVTEVVTQTVTNPPAAQAVVKTDNRIGYGALKLGMTLEEARATGQTDLTWDSGVVGGCVADGKVTVSKERGVVRIWLPREGKTSRGIGVGSTFGDVKKAYPDASEYRAGWRADVDSNAHYAFVGSSDTDDRYHELTQKVAGIKILANGADCILSWL